MNWPYHVNQVEKMNFATPSPWYDKCPVNQERYRQYAYKRDSVGRSRNHCCRGNALSIACFEYVLVALVTHHTNAALYCHLWPVRLRNIFPRCLINGRFYDEKKLFNIKCVLIFSTILSETFLILRRIQRDIFTHVHRSSYKILVILVRLY